MNKYIKKKRLEFKALGNIPKCNIFVMLHKANPKVQFDNMNMIFLLLNLSLKDYFIRKCYTFLIIVYIYDRFSIV